MKKMISNMDPAQTSIGLDKKIQPERAADFEPNRIQGGCLEIKGNLGLNCTNNYEDETLHAESQFDQYKVEKTEDSEPDVLECADTIHGAVPAQDLDATENSSSFGGTFSGTDDEMKLNSSSDAELESQFPGENGDFTISDGYRRVFRRKKLSTHWRRFIRPLMWRCRWIELRMRELQSLSLKYAQELSGFDEQKRVHENMVATDKSAARSVPMACRSHRKQVMKRRKRRRIEDTVDISSYLYHHTVFSYYDSRTIADDLSLDDDGCGDQVNAVKHNIEGREFLGDNFELDFWDDDHAIEQILLDIETTQARVLKLKSEFSKAICRITEEVSTLGMFVRGDPSSSSALSLSCSPVNDRDALPGGAMVKHEYEVEDMIMPGSEVSSFGDAAHPDIIESTVDLPSSAIDVSLNQHQMGDLVPMGTDIPDDILINNQAAEKERQDFEKVSHPMEKKLSDTVKGEEEESIAPRFSGSETGSETERVAMSEGSVLKRCPESDIHVRRSNRKRVERKLGPEWTGGKVRRRRSSKDE